MNENLCVPNRDPSAGCRLCRSAFNLTATVWLAQPGPPVRFARVTKGGAGTAVSEICARPSAPGQQAPHALDGWRGDGPEGQGRARRERRHTVGWGEHGPAQTGAPPCRTAFREKAAPLTCCAKFEQRSAGVEDQLMRRVIAFLGEAGTAGASAAICRLGSAP